MRQLASALLLLGWHQCFAVGLPPFLQGLLGPRLPPMPAFKGSELAPAVPELSFDLFFSDDDAMNLPLGQPLRERTWTVFVFGTDSKNTPLAPDEATPDANSCSQDLADLCPEVVSLPPGTLETSFAAQMCLVGFQDRLQPRCRSYLDNEQNLVTACHHDITSHCDGVQPGGSRVHLCLQAHRDDLSLQCARQIDTTANRMSQPPTAPVFSLLGGSPPGAPAPALGLSRVREPWLDDDLSMEPQFQALATLFSGIFGDDWGYDEEDDGDAFQDGELVSMPCSEGMLTLQGQLPQVDGHVEQVPAPGQELDALVAAPTESVNVPAPEQSSETEAAVDTQEPVPAEHPVAGQLEDNEGVSSEEQQDDEGVGVSWVELLALLALVLATLSCFAVCTSVAYRAMQRARMRRMHAEFRKTYAPMLP